MSDRNLLPGQRLHFGTSPTSPPLSLATGSSTGSSRIRMVESSSSSVNQSLPPSLLSSSRQSTMPTTSGTVSHNPPSQSTKSASQPMSGGSDFTTTMIKELLTAIGKVSRTQDEMKASVTGMINEFKEVRLLDHRREIDELKQQVAYLTKLLNEQSLGGKLTDHGSNQHNYQPSQTQDNQQSDDEVQLTEEQRQMLESIRDENKAVDI